MRQGQFVVSMKNGALVERSETTKNDPVFAMLQGNVLQPWRLGGWCGSV